MPSSVAGGVRRSVTGASGLLSSVAAGGVRESTICVGTSVVGLVGASIWRVPKSGTSVPSDPPLSELAVSVVMALS